jgi:hypothetical protein
MVQHAIRVHRHKVDLKKLLKDIDQFQLNHGSTSIAQYRVDTIALCLLN